MNHPKLVKDALATVPSFAGVKVQLGRVEPAAALPFVAFQVTDSTPANSKRRLAAYRVPFQVAIVHQDQNTAQAWADDLEVTLYRYCTPQVQGIRPTGRTLVNEDGVEWPLLILTFNLLTR
jgi:hypothetical protein